MPTLSWLCIWELLNLSIKYKIKKKNNFQGFVKDKDYLTIITNFKVKKGLSLTNSQKEVKSANKTSWNKDLGYFYLWDEADINTRERESCSFTNMFLLIFILLIMEKIW